MINIYISGKNKGVLEINVFNISYMIDLDYTCTVKDFFSSSAIQLALQGYFRKLKNEYDLNKETIELETKQIYEDCIRNFNHDIIMINYSFDNDNDLLRYIDFINNTKEDYEYIIKAPEKYDEQKKLLDLLNKNLLPSKRANLKIRYQYGSDYISLDQFMEMYNKIISTVEIVKNSKLSPLEQVMFVYDVAKSKVYKKNPKNYFESCNLHSIVNGDSIVCSGYSNYIEYILKQLGFKVSSKIFSYETRETLHQRNMVYIYDEKYGINNVLLFDATYDSKKDEEYLDNYKYFGKPCNFFRKTKEHYDNELDFVYEYSYEELKEMMKNFSIYARAFVTVNHIMGTNNLSKLDFNNQEPFLKTLKEFKEITNKGISRKQFLECLYNVRSFQYEQGILKKEYDILDYEKTLIKKYGKDYLITKEEKMFDMIFGGVKSDRSKLKELLNEFQSKQKVKRKQR